MFCMACTTGGHDGDFSEIKKNNYISCISCDRICNNYYNCYECKKLISICPYGKDECVKYNQCNNCNELLCWDCQFKCCECDVDDHKVFCKNCLYNCNNIFTKCNNFTCFDCSEGRMYIGKIKDNLEKYECIEECYNNMYETCVECIYNDVAMKSRASFVINNCSIKNKKNISKTLCDKCKGLDLSIKIIQKWWKYIIKTDDYQFYKKIRDYYSI